MNFSPVYNFSPEKSYPSKPQCTLAYGRRTHPLGVLPRGPLAHPPLAASDALRLGEHNPCYRKLLCAIFVCIIPEIVRWRRYAWCVIYVWGRLSPVAIIRAFFYYPPLGLFLTRRPPLARSVRKGTNRANLTLPSVGTNRRPFLSPFSVTFLCQKTIRPEPPPTLLSVNKKNGEALARTAALFVFYFPRAQEKTFQKTSPYKTPTPTPLFVRGLSPGRGYQSYSSVCWCAFEGLGWEAAFAPADASQEGLYEVLNDH